MRTTTFSCLLLALTLFSCGKENTYKYEPSAQEKSQWDNELQTMHTALSNVTVILSPLNTLPGKDIQQIGASANIIQELTLLGTINVGSFEQAATDFINACQAARNLGANQETILFALSQNPDQTSGTPCYDAYEAAMYVAYGDLIGCVLEGGSFGCLFSWFIASSVANGTYYNCMQTNYGG